jgi:hypothetical protein
VQPTIYSVAVGFKPTLHFTKLEYEYITFALSQEEASDKTGQQASKVGLPCNAGEKGHQQESADNRDP